MEGFGWLMVVGELWREKRIVEVCTRAGSHLTYCAQVGYTEELHGGGTTMLSR